MSAKTHLCALVQQVRHLLGCQFAILFLGCSDPLLCHPLLSRFSFMRAILSTDDVLEHNLSYDGTLSALCDITIQTGLIWRIDCCVFHHVACSMVAVPLESARGTLGVLVCLDTRQESFLCGEYTLLVQHLPTLIQRVEAVLHEACSSSHTFADDILANMREQNKFISMVSHELRVPLTAIKGYAGLLHAYGISDAQNGCVTKEMTAVRQRQYLSAIIEQVDHMALLISDLLDVSRIQAGRLALHCREINVSLLCQRILQIMQDRVDRQSPGLYRFRCTIEPDLPLAWADPDRVQQILVNLLENAVKYSPDGGVIEMLAYTFQQQGCERSLHPLLCSAGKQSEEDTQEMLPSPPRHSALCMLGITICDRGIGIPCSQQHTLFQPFIRLKHPATSQIAGSGLGLYISRRLVETMHGHIFLHSKEGKGTSVTFTLPFRCIE
jgi:signal transduction histidine kinase